MALLCLVLPVLAGAVALAVDVAGGHSRPQERVVDVLLMLLVLRPSFGLLRRSAWSRWFLVILVALSLLALPLVWVRMPVTEGERVWLLLQALPMAAGAGLLLTPAAGRWFRK